MRVPFGKILSESIILMMVLSPVAARPQQRPQFVERNLPNPAPNTIQVKFAFGANAVTCRRFYLNAQEDGKIIIRGWFRGSFSIPERANHLPSEQKLELTLSCDDHSWHFTHVPEKSFLWGYWWVGTDFPPYQESLQSEDAKNYAWIKYLIVDPSDAYGFTVYRPCFYEPVAKYGLCMPN
jgi:hypothetical protein